MDLDQLQGQIKRDPEAYKDEFLQQHQHFQSVLQIFLLKPSQEHDDFVALVKFLSQVIIIPIIQYLLDMH